MRNAQDIVITGLGPVTPLGIGMESLQQALAAGQTNVTTRRLAIDIGHFVDVPMVAMPSEAPKEFEKHIAYLHEAGMAGYRDLLYSLRAIELALLDAKLTLDAPCDRVGMIQAYEAPGVERTVGDLFNLFGPEAPPMAGPPKVYDLLAPRFYNMQPFLYVHVLAKAFGLRGFCTNIHNACSTGAFAIEMAAERIRAGDVDAMIVIGGECFDTAVRLEWFRKLDLYAREPKMRPFDAEASGFFVGEGAAAIILESAAHAHERGAKPIARYASGSFGHQAWKQTIPDVRTALLSRLIGNALEKGGVTAKDIDLVVPHGTATTLSDGYESLCLEKAALNGTSGAVLTAFKPYVGHTLAASGLIELICSLSAMRTGVIPPTPGSASNHNKLPLPVVREPRNKQVNALLKLSTGFTGHDAAAVYRRCE